MSPSCSSDGFSQVLAATLALGRQGLAASEPARPDDFLARVETLAVMVIPNALFEHRAVLYARDKRPFSEVDEVYQRELLAFPLPGR
jgi:hypothetical protein